MSKFADLRPKKSKFSGAVVSPRSSTAFRAFFAAGSSAGKGVGKGGGGLGGDVVIEEWIDSNNLIFPVHFSNSNVFGMPSFSVLLEHFSFANTQSFGDHALSIELGLVATHFANTQSFGSPELSDVTIWYVAAAADGGSDSNDGLAETDEGGGVGPKLTVAAGLTLLNAGAAGDRLRIRGGANGIYAPTGGGDFTAYFTMTAGGSSGNHKVIEGWLNGAVPAWDDLPVISGVNRSGGGVAFMQLNSGAAFLTVQYLELTRWNEGGTQFVSATIDTRASNVTFQRNHVHHNKCTGLGVQGFDLNNIHILENDLFRNGNPANYGDSDGAQISFGTGTGCKINFNRIIGNGDDGIDLFDWSSPIEIIGNRVAYNGKKGYEDDLATWSGGDGNGIKLGQDGGAHYVAENLVWANHRAGFSDNGNISAMEIFNNTVYANEGKVDATTVSAAGFNMWDGAGSVAIMRNNISYDNPGGAFNAGGSEDDVNNTWNAGAPTVTDGDFVSVSDAGYDDNRGANWELPSIEFMWLITGSDLIDAGATTDGEPFDDLGFHESG